MSMDKLLQAEIGEEVRIIIPIEFTDQFSLVDNRQLYWNGEVFPLSTMTQASPLQTGDDFFIAEGFTYYDTIDKVYYKDNKFVHGNEIWQDASQMTSEQSRFHGIVINVEVRRLDIDFGEYWVCNNYVDLVTQHNILHDTDIKPYLNDYMFRITIRRVK